MDAPLQSKAARLSVRESVVFLLCSVLEAVGEPPGWEVGKFTELTGNFFSSV